MFHRSALMGVVAAMLVTGPARADSLRPIESKDIDLGTMTGTVYYTVETGGYRVVATLQTVGDVPMPMRFVATLAPDQAIALSTPRKVGEPPIEVRFVHRGDQVLVERGGVVTEAARASATPPIP
jgi:hypothetical protein